MSTNQNNTPIDGIALPIVRRSFPQLFADTIVGVKPMTEEEALREAEQMAERRAKWLKEMHKDEIKNAGRGWKV